MALMAASVVVVVLVVVLVVAAVVFVVVVFCIECFWTIFCFLYVAVPTVIFVVWLISTARERQ
jgi:hypothetical protein